MKTLRIISVFAALMSFLMFSIIATPFVLLFVVFPYYQISKAIKNAKKPGVVYSSKVLYKTR
jgi:hypothetical protein